ncbi:MAG: nitrogen regulation protein NR(II) [Gammaproteobacteria bacterium]|nr:nitrogen regulation protein NR(II) [Gammaproteobacteria bacterium]
MGADTLSFQLLEQLGLAVVVLDETGTVRFCNQHGSMMFGQSKKKMMGCKIRDLLVRHTFPDRLLDELWECGRSFLDNEVEFVFPDGRHITTEVTADTAKINNETLCVLQIRQNDNLRKINQENTQKHHILASRHLIRGLAHEIKNPLGGIRGAAQLLARSLETDELKEYTQLIIEQSDRLRQLVDRLLGPNTPPKRERTNIHVVLERICSLVNLDKPDSVEIYRDYDPSLPLTVIDPNQIEQAALNIVRNGIQALTESIVTEAQVEQPPKLTIKTRFAGSKVIQQEQYKQVLKISIIDNGPGISEDLIDTIFYPLVTNKSDGNGLGLSIAQTLVDQHKGKITVESQPGRTAFNIYLPVIEQDEGKGL